MNELMSRYLYNDPSKKDYSIIFLRSKSALGWVIRLATWSKFNHAAIEVEGKLYEANEKGVVLLEQHYPEDQIERRIYKDAPSIEEMKENIKNYLGTPYDYANFIFFQLPQSIFGFWLGSPSASRVICSEFVARVLNIEFADRLSPKMLYKMTLPINENVK